MARTTEPDPVREDVSPAEIPGTGRIAILKRTVKEFQEDNLTDWAAALTYYSVLALFPALIALVSIIGLVGDPKATTNTLLDIVRQLSPDSVKTLQGPIQDITANRSNAGIGLIVGL